MDSSILRLRIFRMGVGLILACLLLTNVTLADKQDQGVPDFHDNEITANSVPAMTMYDFEYSKSSYRYSSGQTTRQSVLPSVALDNSLPKPSSQEKDFPPLLLILDKKKESKVQEKTKTKELNTNKDESEVLSTEEQIKDVVQIMDQMDESTLIAAQPFDKIALHFEGSLSQEDTQTITLKAAPEKERASDKKVEIHSSEMTPDKMDDSSQGTLKTKIMESEYTQPQVEEKMPNDIDFDSVMSILGEAVITSVKESWIWSLQDKLSDFSSAVSAIAKM